MATRPTRARRQRAEPAPLNRGDLRRKGALDQIEAAAYLGVTLRILRRWRERRIGPPYAKHNRSSVTYLTLDLDDWLDARRVSA